MRKSINPNNTIRIIRISHAETLFLEVTYGKVIIFEQNISTKITFVLAEVSTISQSFYSKSKRGQP